jgi:hypothetical protein
MGRESGTESEKPEALIMMICNGGATLSLHSSFLNCAEITERVVVNQTAQGNACMLQEHTREFGLAQKLTRNQNKWQRQAAH